MKLYLNSENTVSIDLAPIILALPTLIIIPIIIYILYLSFKGIKANVAGSKLIFWGLISHLLIGFLGAILLETFFINSEENTLLITAFLVSFIPMLILIAPLIGLKRMIDSHITKTSKDS